MLRLSRRAMGQFCFLLLIFSLVANFTWAQSETATVSGQVVDPSGLNITGAQVKLVDIDRDTSSSVTTNAGGLYTFPSVRPGRYRMAVTAAGFKVVNVTDVTINVQDHLEQNFKLVVGSVSESITVEGGAPLVDTESATVSTVVDRNFAENLPMNGRSFQTLIELTPGVVLTTSNPADNGQFSVNGQRAAANYWMVDGVSANIGIGSNTPGNGFGGTLGSFSAFGGTNSLVSVDALQEFRVQTSTYAPEFGRTPGGQISIVTRSGTNQFHGTGFDYLRNDIFDASDWFNGYINDPPVPKSKERQNDFGGTISGPIFKSHTFFFFSYEGLRLRLPQTTLTDVPDLSARQNAVLSMRPYLNAFPLPGRNAVDDPMTGIAQFTAGFSNPASLDAYSLRIDQKLSDKLLLFGRYNYSPSEIAQRAAGGQTLNTVDVSGITTQTATAGVTWLATSTITNDFRFNYSRTRASSRFDSDTFGGAVPLTSLPIPSPFTGEDSQFQFEIGSLGLGGLLAIGRSAENIQRQFNVVDSLSLQKGPHSLKFGVDFRRLSPQTAPPSYNQLAYFSDVPSTTMGNSLFGETIASRDATMLFHNLGAFAQDTWHIHSRLTLTFGLRWDLDFAPSSLNGPSIPAVTGYNLSNFSQLAIAPVGTSPFKTKYGNIASRLGLSYQVAHRQAWETVLRGGAGIFYDLVSSETGNAISPVTPPFGNLNVLPAAEFPFTSAQIAPPPIPSGGIISSLFVFNPNLRLPYTIQWNATLDQSLGTEQTITASYLGAAGRHLLQTSVVISPPTNANLVGDFIDNTATSNYQALQVQFRRRLSHGLQALVSYSWSHSIDDGSAGSFELPSNAGLPGNASANRGPSDFDIRNSISLGATYDIPAPKSNPLTKSVLRGWSTENFVLARSAPPANVTDFNALVLGCDLSGGISAQFRPDLVPGQPLYLYESQYPGGKAFNPDAFSHVPADPTTGCPMGQGTVPRNFLRAFGATQWDSAIHRDFVIREAVRLQFRAEMFNALNHPNFGPPYPFFGLSMFGLSQQMLGQSLNGSNLGGGAFSPLYQIGGPRSVQFTLKLSF
jgi:hypothetical protein